MPYKAFVYFEKKIHRVLIASLELKRLEEKVAEIANSTKNDDDKIVNSTQYFKIVDNNNQEITDDKQLKTAFDAEDVLLLVHPIDNNNDETKYPEDKKIEEEDNDEHHNILNPLVLLAGAAKYKNLDYLPGVKVDLMMFRNLFEDVYGYE
ncbi:hypothetical protein RFI_40161, partial [Reticulomyxa filosa]